MDAHIPAALVKEVRQRAAVLFAGAGLSFEALHLTRTHFRAAVGEAIRAHYPAFEPEAWTVQEVYDAYEGLTDRLTLCQRLAEVMPADASPTAAHSAAVSSFRCIITTNWDTLLEQAAERLRLRFSVICCDADMDRFDAEGLNILKIHGCRLRPETLVASSEDHDIYRETHGRLREAIGELIGAHPVVYVGYSFRDDHLRRLLREVVRERGRDMRRGYAVVFPDEVMGVVLRRWRIELLPFRPDFLVRLAEVAGTMAAPLAAAPDPTTSAEYDLFIAYNSADRGAARDLYQALTARGLRPWFDEEALSPGDRWSQHIEAAIGSVACAALLFGAAGPGSWQRGEMEACLDACFGRGLRVIPVLLPGGPDAAELPNLVRIHHASDLRGGLTPSALDHLAQAIRGAVGRSPRFVLARP